MTAVAVQQHGAHRQQLPRQSPHSSNMSSPHNSRPHSYSQGPAHMRQELPIQNGNSGPMNARPAVSNDPVHVVNGNRAPSTETESRRASTLSAATSNGESSTRRSSSNVRPNSASRAAESSQEETDVDRSRRRPRPLLRSKSDFGPRNEDADAQEDESWKDWGARHGFEDHYNSAEYVSQLANVSRSFLV